MAKFVPEKKIKEVISVRLDYLLLQELDSYSIEVNLSRNELINQCIAYALNNRDFQENKVSNHSDK